MVAVVGLASNSDYCCCRFSLRTLKYGCLRHAVYCCPQSGVYLKCPVKANLFICLSNLPQLPNYFSFYLHCVICLVTKLLQLWLQPLKLQLSSNHRFLLLSHFKSMAIKQIIGKCGSKDGITIVS